MEEEGSKEKKKRRNEKHHERKRENTSNLAPRCKLTIQKAMQPMQTSSKFFMRIFCTFAMRTLPASTSENPACMKKTIIAAIRSHMLSASVCTCWSDAVSAATSAAFSSAGIDLRSLSSFLPFTATRSEFPGKLRL